MEQLPQEGMEPVSRVVRMVGTLRLGSAVAGRGQAGRLSYHSRPRAEVGEPGALNGTPHGPLRGRRKPDVGVQVVGLSATSPRFLRPAGVWECGALNGPAAERYPTQRSPDPSGRRRSLQGRDSVPVAER